MKQKKKPAEVIPVNTSKFLRLARSQIDIKQLVKEDIEDDFIKNEANKMRYYDLNYTLKPIEGDYAYLEDIPFNSMHKINDSKVKKRIMKLLQKPDRNELEVEVLRNIAGKQGKLLSEINYEFDNEIISSSAKLVAMNQDSNALPMINKKKVVMETIVGYKNESESKIVENLDQWVSEKIKRGNKKQKKEEQFLREAKTLEPNTPMLSRRGSVMGKFSSMATPHMMNLIHPRKSHFSNEKTEDGKVPSPVGGRRNGSARDEKNQSDDTPASRNTDEDPAEKVKFGRRTLSYAASGMMPRSVTVISLKKRQKSQKKKEDRKEGFVALPNFDNLEEMLNNDKAEQNLLKALNTEHNEKSGVASIIKEMMEMKANEESSVIQSAIFYEKQNRVIESKLMKIMKDIEGLINTKQSTIRSLRIENAKISKKMGYISKYPSRNEKGGDGRRQTLASIGTYLLNKRITFSEDMPLTQEQRDMKESLKLFKKKFEMNHKELTKLEEEAQLKKKEMKSVLNSKKKFLLEILQKGVDVRDQGLVWIIKTLGSDGVNVTIDELPPFLDSRSKSYLFMRARMEIELNELQTLRKTIIEIYRASTDGEENADAQNIFEPMFQVGEFDRKKAENKTPSQITLLNASMRTTQNLFLPSLNSTVTGISINLHHRDSSGQASFYLNHSRTLSQPHLQALNQSFSFTNMTQNPDLTSNAGVGSQNMHSIEERNSQTSSVSNRNHDLDVSSDFKKSRFHNNQRKLMPHKKKESQEKKPTGLSEFLSLHMTSEMQDNDDKSESKSSFSSHTPESDQDTPSDEGKNDEEQEENIEQEREPLSYQAQLITSLYHSLPEYPHDRNFFTVNEKMFRMTKDSIYNLIKNQENKETMNYRDGENNRDKIENRLKIYEGNTLLNDYENRTQFIEKVENLQKQIEALEQRMKYEEDVEAERMINEFENKNYKKRFNTEITIVLPAIFGAHKGEKILIRYGLIRNSFKKKGSWNNMKKS